jgi:putative DNA primase/helicase
VVSIEVDDGKKLAEGLVKMVTGGDTVRARHLYQEGFEYVPQFKLWLAANHAPRVKADDDAMWRRILRVPFDRAVPPERRDPTLKARLKDVALTGPAILAWAVKGCLRWLETGLVVPVCVKDATEQYRTEMDHLQDFLEEAFDFGPELIISAKQLWIEYGNWAKFNGIKEMADHKQMAERLRSLGCAPDRDYVLGQRQRIWRGIGPAAKRPETE